MTQVRLQWGQLLKLFCCTSIVSAQIDSLIIPLNSAVDLSQNFCLVENSCFLFLKKQLFQIAFSDSSSGSLKSLLKDHS